MLQILNEKMLKSDDEIQSQYKNCKYLCILDNLEQITGNDGYLYCVSTSVESLKQLIYERDRLQEQGKLCFIGGSYNNGGALGVQYEYEE